MLTNYTVKEFSAEVASSSPAPGGGSVSALAGAQAAALLSMYCNLTIGKEKYAQAEAVIKEALAVAGACREELMAAVDADTRAFEMVMDAFRMPKATPDEKATRQESVQTAFKEAARVPLEVCRHSVRLLEVIAGAVDKGNESALSDIGVANLQAYAALTGAAYNVLINLTSIKDQDYVRNCSQELDELRKKGSKCYSESCGYIEAQLKI